MAKKYDLKSLWKMKKEELLAIAKSEEVEVDPETHRSTLVKILYASLPEVIPVAPVSSSEPAPVVDDSPASVRIRRIRAGNQ